MAPLHAKHPKGLCAKCGDVNDRVGRRQRYCGLCHAAYMREWRRTHPLKGAALRRARARAMAGHARRSGKLTEKPCEVCGATERIEMHHDDYRRPLEVRWFCRPHHVDLTSNLRNGKPEPRRIAA